MTEEQASTERAPHVGNDAGTLQVAELLCEYCLDPLAIDTSTPRFYWTMTSNRRGRVQTAYRILVAESEMLLEQDRGNLWDSGKVESSRSTHVSYEGEPLRSCTDYFWKVLVWDNEGSPSCGHAARFGTALQQSSDWKADWIGTGPSVEPRTDLDGLGAGPDQTEITRDKNLEELKPKVEVDSRSVLLRKEASLSAEPMRARAYVTGLGLYELRINGAKIGDDAMVPAKTDYRKRVLYNTYDVTEQLSAGPNAIGIQLGNGWFNPEKKHWGWHMQWYGSPRALLQIHIEYGDGTSEIITSDATWKASAGPIVNSCIYDGEVYDANLESPGWDQPGFDESGWRAANVVEAPGGELCPHTMPPVKVVETTVPVAVTELKPGVYVYDMGQNHSGWVRCTVKGPKGAKLVLRYAENIHDDGSIDPESNCKAEATDTYILKGDENGETYEPRFTYHGFRYVEITGLPEGGSIEEVQGRVVHTACESTGRFECGNDLVNKIHRCSRWTIRNTMQGLPIDCPQRDERLGWGGVAHVASHAAMYNFDMPLFYMKWLRDIEVEQSKETGDLPHISPRTAVRGRISESCAYVLLTWYFHLHYGDTAILERHYDGMRRYVEFLHRTSTDHIMPVTHRETGDWLSVEPGWERGDPESMSTGFAFYNTKIVADVARILGKDQDACKYAQLAEDIRNAFNARFLDRDTAQYGKGSQAENAFPLFLNMVPEDQVDAVLKNLISNITEKNNGHLTTGVYGTKYMMDALVELGQADLAYALVLKEGYPGWAHMLRDRTTITEKWEPTEMSSCQPPFGSVDAWLYRVLAGIALDPESPGFQHFVIRPRPMGEMPWVSAECKSIHGRIVSKWELKDGCLRMEVEIPVNTTATVHVPTSDPTSVTESGKPVGDAEGVSLLRTEDNAAVYRVGSGQYVFAALV